MRGSLLDELTRCEEVIDGVRGRKIHSMSLRGARVRGSYGTVSRTGGCPSISTSRSFQRDVFHDDTESHSRAHQAFESSLCDDYKQEHFRSELAAVYISNPSQA